MFLYLLFACDEPESDPLAGLSLVAEDNSDNPLGGLDADWTERFNEGDVAFEALFRESQGLGPNYIRASCASCHADDARGPGIVTKMVVPGDAEVDAALLPLGHTERPHVAGGATTPLVAPDDARVLVTTRVPPAVFGRGYMEAVADDTLEALAAEQASAGVVSGRVNHVPCDFEANPDSLFPACEPGATVAGRFGLKARVPTLDGFAADAYQGDMAITSPMRPSELANPDGLDDDAREGVDIDLETVNLTADYMRLLSAPEQSPQLDGLGLFEAAECDDCHVPALPTRSDWPVEPLAGIDAPLFTDMLLHDMGEAFSDGLADHEALPSEWRTAPLMGLRHLRSYLHDGRAQTVLDAILAHGEADSEAARSVELFNQLDEADRADLVAFVESL